MINDIKEDQEQADLNIWLCFGGKDIYNKRQEEILKEVFE